MTRVLSLTLSDLCLTLCAHDARVGIHFCIALLSGFREWFRNWDPASCACPQSTHKLFLFIYPFR